jgi:hypothetical protein
MTAWKTVNQRPAELALSVIDDTARKPLTSELVRVELLLKAVFLKRQDEVSFKEFHHDASVIRWTAGCMRPSLIWRPLRTGRRRRVPISHLRSGSGRLNLSTRSCPARLCFLFKEIRVITLHAAASGEA